MSVLQLLFNHLMYKIDEDWQITYHIPLPPAFIHRSVTSSGAYLQDNTNCPESACATLNMLFMRTSDETNLSLYASLQAIVCIVVQTSTD